MHTKILLIIALSTLFTIGTFAQSEDGYWDQERKTEKEIPLADHKRKWLRAEIPTGTTQLVYRVSFLDENGQLRSSLSSTIGSLPSVTAQGSSAILSLLNVIGGSNKGQYFIFTSKEDADYYCTNNIVQNACYANSNNIPSDKNVLYLNKSACLSESTQYLWFAFYNANYMDDQKVVLEVLPWIDKKASLGWSQKIKNFLYDYLVKSIKQSNENIPSETIEKNVNCILTNLTSDYTFNQFQLLAEYEKKNYFDKLESICNK
ncbi:hypothetical protein [Flavobacterium sp. N1994]|uniref:hypothetical protein n=1 Tax=Flavobacterium sp. N1994 TaxID=2986827 RepID=UPI002221DB07|nr:hypothetical protein [Flavobacterium sp. N1994]